MKVAIEKSIYGGAGLGQVLDGDAAGQTAFVRFSLPEEEVEVLSTGSIRGAIEADLLDVLTASKDRVEPRCAHFGSCGGCQYQHASYEAQTAIKAGILRETMERAGLVSLPEIGVLTGDPWQYRNRVRLRIKALAGELRVGYSVRGTHQFLPIVECPIAAPLLWRAATSLLKVAKLDAAAGRVLAGANEVEFFATADEMRLQMTIFSGAGTASKGMEQGFERLCIGLRMLVPELSGGGWMLTLEGRGAPAASTRWLARWGAEGLVYEAADRKYWVSRGGFFQVNRWLTDDLVRLVTGGRKGLVAWDLFAGVGLFSRVLASEFAVVTAVEASPIAARDLRHAMARLGSQHRAVASTAVEFLRRAVVERERPELVVLDPPRAGAGAEVCGLLARVQPAEIIYVSCDPTTLGRDLKVMVDSGYNLAELHLVDLFPQTFHLETVAILRR